MFATEHIIEHILDKNLIPLVKISEFIQHMAIKLQDQIFKGHLWSVLENFLIWQLPLFRLYPKNKYINKNRMLQSKVEDTPILNFIFSSAYSFMNKPSNNFLF